MPNLHRPKFNADSKARKANTPNISSVIVSLLLSGITIFFTISCFPVLPQIYLPLSFTTLVFYMLPAILIAAIATNKLVLNLKNLWRNYSRLTLGQTLILFLSLLLLIIGVSKAFYHMNPVNNFNAYVKQREEIVELIHSGQLKGEKQSSAADYNRGIKINLPEKFKNLSQQGQVSAIANGGVLEVIFDHSTIGFFGDGVNYLIYRSDSDEQKSAFFLAQKFHFTHLEKLKDRWFFLASSY